MRKAVFGAYEDLISCPGGKALADLVLKGVKEDLEQTACHPSLPQKPECDGFFPDYYNPQFGPTAR